jgi:TolB-like protein/Flp pilus assembly protein TadD
MLGFPVVLILAWVLEPPSSDAELILTPRAKAARSDMTWQDWLIVLAAFGIVGGSIWQFAYLGRAALPIAAAPGGTTLPASSPSIAVMPFVNMSGDATKDYFSDGISEELLNDLANSPDLHVAARTSSFSFKGRNVAIDEIARRLHVRTILEGSVREEGRHIRITAQLINAADGFHIWSRTYDRDLVDILAVQTELARAITQALTRQLLGSKVVSGRPRTIDPAVYRKFLLAKSLFDKRTEADNERALAMFREVTAAQPDFADAWASLGHAYVIKFDRQNDFYGVSSFNPEDYEAAQRALDKALALDPKNLHALSASVTLSINRQDWRAASAFVGQMNSINPHNAVVLNARALYLSNLGFFQRAVQTFEKAARLDPLSFDIWINQSISYIYVNNYDLAIRAAETALKLAPQHPAALISLCSAYGYKNRVDEVAKLQEAIIKLPGGDQFVGCKFQLARLTGRLDDARKMADSINPLFAAVDHLLLGDFDRAMDFLERDFRENEYSLYSYSCLPILRDTVVKTPRWKLLAGQPRFRAWQAEHDRVARLFAANLDIK